jgi:hypothetical protein
MWQVTAKLPDGQAVVEIAGEVKAKREAENPTEKLDIPF